MFKNIYNNKKVLITGHTGFKGSWLSSWLIKLGANVTGVSNGVPTSPSMYQELNLSKKLNDLRCDVRDLLSLKKIINDTKPDFIFHLAAQAIVSTSYSQPVDTITTNVIGTMNILESLCDYKDPCTVVMITSDKCYDNVEWIWGYKESDRLGGKDVYSGSKGAAELIIKSYCNSFFKSDHPVKISIGRAGNVIGGGDWASDRIIVDCMKAWSKGKSLEIRSPEATRPWQHVLEPLSGYLTLGEKLYKDSLYHSEPFNFGPRSEQNQTVIELINDLSNYCNFSKKKFLITDNIKFHEASLLKLNCDKALSFLKWDSTLTYNQTVKLVSEWYDYYYNSKSKIDLYNFTLNQISEYENIAAETNKSWCN